ncbi:carboxymuconolactone decarboxylase family protein [Roseomonas rosulenta]|uniref:carboxymuconolactone decarboxylase family protein n=1 Tax=Roseomonas rosulenta TaxID=2748667 RepID=UPI0018E054E4|nr:carboxymuconolactone decarboxylase family protein [Roseomonas rosulenta]
MPSVTPLRPEALAPELREVWQRYATTYGPFEGQLEVFAHVPAALRHLMPMLMELRAAATLPRRALELAIVVVSKLNACDYCIAHHQPFLAVEGIPPEVVAGLPADADHASLTPCDRAVIAFSVAAWEDSHRVPERLFRDLRAHFTEAQIVELTLRITLTGFFNRFSSVLGIEEEATAHA